MTLPSSGRHRDQVPVPTALSVSRPLAGRSSGPPQLGTDDFVVVA